MSDASSMNCKRLSRKPEHRLDTRRRHCVGDGAPSSRNNPDAASDANSGLKYAAEMRTQRKAALRPSEDYWKARGDRAIAASLLLMGASLVLRRDNLRLRRQTLELQAAIIRAGNAKDLHRFGRRAADYYRAHGRLLRLAKRLGQRLDRHSPNVTKLA